MELPTLDRSDIEKLFKYHPRQQAEKILEVIVGENKFKEAFFSEIGQELFKHASFKLEELFNKIVYETANEQDKAEFRVLKSILINWTEKINNYIKHIDGVKTIKEI